MLRATASALALVAAMLPAAAQETPATTPATPAAPATPAPAVPYDAGSVLATVNGTPVTLGLLHLVFTTLPQQYQGLPGEVLLPALLDQVINQILLAQDSEKAGNGTQAEVQLAADNARRDALASRLVRGLIAEAVTEDAVKQAYDAKVAALPPEQEASAAHILVESEEKAKEIATQARAGTPFAELAKQSADTGSGANGGELGWFARGQMVPTFEEAVFKLKPGEISDPVQTQFGWHVIRLNELRDKPKPSFEEMRGQIANELSELAVRTRIEALRADGKIEKPRTGISPEALKDPALFGN